MTTKELKLLSLCNNLAVELALISYKLSESQLITDRELSRHALRYLKEYKSWETNELEEFYK